MKDKFETFRASEKEQQELKRMAKKANMSKSDYIRHCVFNKEITVIDGLDDFAKQLKAIGNNLNQLTTRANMGHFEAVNLAETKEQLGKIYDLLTSLCKGETATETAVATEEPSVTELQIETDTGDLPLKKQLEKERNGFLSFLNRRF
ncbi:MAG TPA: plasmid mobilization relaxosome protein MobC [Oscillospiraceae bacterium]|jgi:hypothetical protein|nr:MobC family plasmid mobilization relaxosome protein [Clostridiales bacterium]HOP10993.1 plasmid mobilization relaxosome protein MobC [Oscillospiraceae bacterium]HPF55147.1 plasmid mobilization relaxosome protein MobC [Clostridiales bacterium]HPK34476.1 plasmid mobilization relaxosome protein MobC [Oscillospiraceae bacterium]HPR76302.1 plasmid mobilization relaxosome protein MobC [Oscillospiraceae bacterium]